MDFYDIHEQTPYSITVSMPENEEDLSDLFVTREELEGMIGRNFYIHTANRRHTFKQSEVIEVEVRKWAEKLEASGKKTLQIDDPELLEVLKEGYLSDYTPDTDKYGRHGNRICFARRYKRVKKKATQGDVTGLWSCLQHGFRNKFGCYPSHIPRYDRHIPMFKAWQKIVGWRATRKHIPKDSVKFYRQIWDNPEEFIK